LEGDGIFDHSCLLTESVQLSPVTRTPAYRSPALPRIGIVVHLLDPRVRYFCSPTSSTKAVESNRLVGSHGHAMAPPIFSDYFEIGVAMLNLVEYHSLGSGLFPRSAKTGSDRRLRLRRNAGMRTSANAFRVYSSSTF
jgi:hypothetical protein